MINGHDCVYIERAGMIERTAVRFKNEAHLLRIINKIVAAVGRRVDESQPLCDARLSDGSRVNVVLRPISIDGPIVSIRKFPTKPHDLAKLVELGALPPEMAQLLGSNGQGAYYAHRLRRYGNRQDDVAQRTVGLHLGQRAARHHRGRG